MPDGKDGFMMIPRLPHLFGVGGYAVIREPEELPRELPLLYVQMAR